MTTKDEFIIQDKENWTLFNENPKDFLKFNKELEDLGIKRVVTNYDADNSTYFEDLTLVLQNPNFIQDYIRGNDYEEICKTYPKLPGYSFGYYYTTFQPQTENEIFVKLGNQYYGIGKYLPNKNIIWLQLQNPKGCNNTFAGGYYEWIVNILKEWKEKLNFKSIKIDGIQIICDGFCKYKQQQLQENIKKIKDFSIEINNCLNNAESYSVSKIILELQNVGLINFLDGNINDTSLNKLIKELDSIRKSNESTIKQTTSIIGDYNKSISLYLKNINDMRETNRALDNPIEKKTFKTYFNGLKDLSFVKNLRVYKDEIRFNIENVKIKYGGKAFNMGNYLVHITPTKIYFDCDRYILLNRDNSEKYFGPHIIERRCCYGTFKEKMDELLSKIQLPELAILIKQFLQTYTPNDKYMDLIYFTGANRLYKKYKNVNFNNDEVSLSIGKGEKDIEITDFEEEQDDRITRYQEPSPLNQRIVSTLPARVIPPTALSSYDIEGGQE